MNTYCLTHLSDGALLHDLSALVTHDRHTTALLLAHLAEVDGRKLYVPAGYPSMHLYCVQELRLSEDAAFKRIRVARAALIVPALFDAIADGSLHLSGAVLLATYLTPDNAKDLLEAANRKSKAEITQMLAERFPSTESLALVETITEHPASEVAAQDQPRTQTPMSQLAPGPVRASADVIRLKPIASHRFALQLAIGQGTHDKLRRAQALLGHQISNGNLTEVLDRVLDLAIHQLEKRKFAATHRALPTRYLSSTDSRKIPAHVRRAVWQRDGGRCTFVSERGRHCLATDHLEFDHIVPIALGGESTAENVRLLCRAHNQYEAERCFGSEFMNRKREAARGRAEVKKSKALANARAEEIVPGLRHLGFTADEARRAAAFCEQVPKASIEERFRAALGYLRPKSYRCGHANQVTDPSQPTTAATKSSRTMGLDAAHNQPIAP